MLIKAARGRVLSVNHDGSDADDICSGKDATQRIDEERSADYFSFPLTDDCEPPDKND